MSWLLKSTTETEGIPLSVLEEIYRDPETGEVELERFIPSLREYKTPELALEEIETLEEIVTDLKMGIVPTQLLELEKELFEKYKQEHKKEIEEHGLDKIREDFRLEFIETIKQLLKNIYGEEIFSKGVKEIFEND